ncbi:membrane-associated protein [Motilibacter peucedani]|uniref:Membrane-associated protein n=1 Tax=Motilibacter peucedani TaxID=598650 RepID=A0A420XUP1_9ACTN|nr:VTT domain-containing protein [Motilibacter peucedani]RKS80545.1 membrane-associated protein [Motilibacter peucedani]
MLAATATAAAQTAALGPSWMDPQQLVESFGAYALVAVLVIVFAECGLLIGFFLPGDSLLFMTGLFIASGSIKTPLWLACVLVAAAAVAGNFVGYAIGWRAGPAIFDKPESRVFKPQHVARTHQFFEKYGTRAIFLARFVPIVRTFITVMAGVGRMDRRSYLTVSALGGIVWGAGITILGWALGDVDWIKDNIELALIAIVALSVVPIAIEALRARRDRAAA